MHDTRWYSCRLARIDRDALRDLLAMARRATLLKAPRSRRRDTVA